MRIETSILPKKINEINYFKKAQRGCEIYSYNEKVEERNEVIVISLNECEIEHDFCVNAKTIQMLNVLNDADVKVTDKSFIIDSKKGKFTAKLLSEQLFNLAQNNFDNEMEIDLNILFKASGYVAKNDKKPILAGVRVDSNGNVYATDSFKAYFYKVDSLSDNGITIPVNFINLIKSFNLENNNIKLYYNKNIIMVEINDNIKVYGRLLDGNYPNMSKILDNRQKASIIEIDKNEMIERLQIAYNVGTTDDKRTIVRFTKNKIEALGDNNYESDILYNIYDDFYLKLQLDFLDQAFKTITEDDLKFSVVYNTKEKMGIMVFVENEKETCLILGIK